MCFLLAGTRVLLLVLRYDIKMQPDSRQARPGRWLPWAAVAAPWPEAAPAAWALRPGAGGARHSAAGPRAARWGGADSATPALRPPPRGRPGVVFQDLISRSS